MDLCTVAYTVICNVDVRSSLCFSRLSTVLSPLNLVKDVNLSNCLLNDMHTVVYLYSCRKQMLASMHFFCAALFSCHAVRDWLWYKVSVPETVLFPLCSGALNRPFLFVFSDCATHRRMVNLFILNERKGSGTLTLYCYTVRGITLLTSFIPFPFCFYGRISFLGRQRRPYIVFTFRYSYSFVFVYIYISVIANGGAQVVLYKALNPL